MFNISDPVHALDYSFTECDDGNEDDHYRSQMNKSMRSFLRHEIRTARYSNISKQIATAKLLKQIFRSNLEDDKFVSWFSAEMNFKDVNSFKHFMIYANTSTPVIGRPVRITQSVAQNIYNFWKENSIISVDRRNNRNVVKIKQEKINQHVRHIEDSRVKVVMTNGREKLHGDRYIYTKSVRELYREYVLKFGDEVSQTMFFKLKPFYIGSPLLREMESCTCISCVNPHYLYKSLIHNIKKKTGKVLPDSLTEYNEKFPMSNQ